MMTINSRTLRQRWRDRKTQERVRKKEAGFIRREFWVLPEHLERITRYVDRVTKEARKNNAAPD